jgi:hypothetical protein
MDTNDIECVYIVQGTAQTYERIRKTWRNTTNEMRNPYSNVLSSCVCVWVGGGGDGYSDLFPPDPLSPFIEHFIPSLSND